MVKPAVGAAKKRSGFVYKPVSAENIRRRAERQGGSWDGPFKPSFDKFVPKSGDNLIRILPPSWEGFDHFGYTIWVHRGIGPGMGNTYLCSRKVYNKKCAVCDAEAECRRHNEEDEAKKLSAREMVIYWVLDRNEGDEGRPKIYMVSWRGDTDLCTQCQVPVRKGAVGSGSVLQIDNPDVGYDVVVKRTGKDIQTRYTFVVDRQESPISDDPKRQDEVLEFVDANPLPTVLKSYPYEYVQQVLSGTAEEMDEDAEESEGNDPVAKQRRVEAAIQKAEATPTRRRPAAQPVEDDDDVEVEVEDEKPRSRVRATAEVDVDVEEEGDDNIDEETGEVLEPADEDDEVVETKTPPRRHVSAKNGRRPYGR